MLPTPITTLGDEMFWKTPKTLTAADIAEPAKSNPKVAAAPAVRVTVRLTKEEITAALVAAAIAAEPNVAPMAFDSLYIGRNLYDEALDGSVSFTVARGA